jgi:hypothetical protein
MRVAARAQWSNSPIRPPAMCVKSHDDMRVVCACCGDRAADAVVASRRALVFAILSQKRPCCLLKGHRSSDFGQRPDADDENARCRVSKARAQPKDFPQLTQPLTTPQRPTLFHFGKHAPSTSRSATNTRRAAAANRLGSEQTNRQAGRRVCSFRENGERDPFRPRPGAIAP